MNLLERFEDQLNHLKAEGNLRQFKSNQQFGKYIQIEQQKMLNLSSNDYLGLASDLELRAKFFDEVPNDLRLMSTSSSRLLTGNFPQYELLEYSLSQAFIGRSALLFNSGYHMNIGILPAISDAKTLILADKLVHASIIDGIRLSNAKYVRYRHNDLQHLLMLLNKYHDDASFEKIIVVTESIFSMDGDETNLMELVEIKKQFNKVMLYVDEAHAIGMRGETGLGCSEQYGVIHEIDFLVGTFGKAIASIGGYLICHSIIREYLVNAMRPLIFSTAQPPINMAWTHFVFEHMQKMSEQRKKFALQCEKFRKMILNKNYECPSSSHIVPVIIGDSENTVETSRRLQQAGFYIMPVRPPTVPQHSSRLRISLNALLTDDELMVLVDSL